MALPSPSDYQDTIQNPTTAFADPELRGGVVAVNHLGLPRVASGNFNSVYEMRCGAQRVAVRCMLRNFSDQQRRYDLVSRHLEGLSLPSLVDFSYLVQGIRVRGQWHPVVKMDWVEGIPLHIYVEQNLHNVPALRKLAARWRGLVNSLRGSHLAHGDLQHGNVLVTGAGDLKLVDYDAMFVPAFHGERSNEVGHINYQHPKRDGDDFDERLDVFAALVIYVSLLALAVAPHLWFVYHNGDNLLFKRCDFTDPQGSPLFKQLHRSPDQTVRSLTQIAEDACARILAAVPDLEQAIRTTEGIFISASSPIAPVVLSASAHISAIVGTGNWWEQSGSPTVLLASRSLPAGVTESLPSVRIVNPKDGAVMLLIPAGEFWMGYDETSICSSNTFWKSMVENNPLRKVILKGYYIYERPVTLGQYRKFVEEMKQQGKQIAGHAAELPPPPNFDATWRAELDPAWNADDHPIVQVTWYEAAAYAEWARVRLPTEAEWEKAARGTDGRNFPWGNEFDNSKLWCSMRERRPGTVPAGIFVEGASPFGVLDMAGNVLQWCSDWYDHDYSLSTSLNDPQGPPAGLKRAVRGSAWHMGGMKFAGRSDKIDFLAARRSGMDPDTRHTSFGFRCAF